MNEEKLNENFIYNLTNSMHIQFVKEQDEFIRKECIKHLSENKYATIFYIDEDKLQYIFDLGLKEYIKKLEKHRRINNEWGRNNKRNKIIKY